MRLLLDTYTSPLCPLLLVTDEQGILRALEFGDQQNRLHRFLHAHCSDYELRDGAAPNSITEALDAYFDGDLKALDMVQVATSGTAFQRRVWQALRTIPAGTTISYGRLAANLGCPSASRAVGAANGSNPTSIVVPCHRVIGASGSLTGYGGGLPRKEWLLAHERKYSGKAQEATSRQLRLVEHF